MTHTYHVIFETYGGVLMGAAAIHLVLMVMGVIITMEAITNNETQTTWMALLFTFLMLLLLAVDVSAGATLLDYSKGH